MSSLNIELDQSAAQAGILPLDHKCWHDVLNVILLLISFSYRHGHAGVFPGKMCSDRRKNHGCEQKTSLH